MNLQTIKIVHGVLSLRRFTAKHLAEFTSSNPSTVGNWLSRHSEWFEAKATPRPGRAGAPEKTWTLTPEGVEHYSSQIGDIPSIALTEALDAGRDFETPVRRDIQQAKEAFAIYRRASDASVRREAWDWFASIERALHKHVDRLRQSGVDTSTFGISEMEWLRRHAQAGFKEQQPSIYASVLKVAGFVWHELDSVPSLEGDPFPLEELVATCQVSEAVGSLGVLAALGVSSKFSPTTRTLDALSAAASIIPNPVYCDGFRELFIEAINDAPADRAVPAVLAGVAAHRGILADHSVVSVIEDVDVSELWQPAVKSAYLRCMLELPRTKLRTVINLAQSTGHIAASTVEAPAALASSDDEVESVSSEFYEVFDEVAEDAIGFAERMKATAPIEADPLDSFGAMFIPAPHVIDERRAVSA